MDTLPLISARELTVGYKAGSGEQKTVAGPIDADMYAGELICLLGPNGAGKSTFLRTISGLQDPLNGNIELGGEQISNMRPAQLARRLSVVLTDSVRSANLDVFSLISLGRYPYSGWLGGLSAEDKKIIQWAIEATHTEAFIRRKVGQLSDGECQKVMLARALAQDTPLIVLDEPTAHLDLPSRIELMRLLHKLAKETNKGILISTHELDLALQVADKIWLLKKDGSLEPGAPETLVLNGGFEAAFDKAGIMFDKSTGTFNIHEHKGKYISVFGEGATAFWTKKALQRIGYEIGEAPGELTAELRESNGQTRWVLKSGSVRVEYSSLEAFLKSELHRF